MKYGDVLGDVTESSHVNWIELNAVNWGVNRSATNPGGSTQQRNLSAARVSELTVTKPQDVASIPLIQDCLHGGSGQPVKIDFVRTGPDQVEVYYSISLTEVLITGFTQGGADVRPVESLTLNFTTITVQGTQMDSSGLSQSPASYAWSVMSGAPA